MIAYRAATPADADPMAALARRCFVETFGHLYRREDLDAFLANHSVERWRAELADPAFQVRLAEADGEPCGYAKLGPPSLPFEPEGVAAELRQLYVLKPWHGTGIAAALMDWVLDRARASGADALYLSVFVDNHRARRFYARYGFEFVQPYTFMVGSHADEDQLLRLRLKGRP